MRKNLRETVHVGGPPHDATSSAFEAVAERELAAANAAADAIDDRPELYRDGGPEVQVVGLAEFIPSSSPAPEK